MGKFRDRNRWALPILDTGDCEDGEEVGLRKREKCGRNRAGALDLPAPKPSPLLDPLRVPSIFFLGFLGLASYVIIPA